MRTINKAFACIFAVLGIAALVAGMFSARHQFVVAFTCAILVWMMWPKKESKSIKNQ